MSVFDALNNISAEKERKDFHEDDYIPFLINKGLSYHPDTILYANEMNIRGNMPKAWHYDYLHASIRKRKRYSKWHKPEKDDNVSLLMEYYKYSRKKAEQALEVLTEDQLDQIRAKMNYGDTSERIDR